MNRPPAARTTEDDGAGSLSRSQTAFLVAALVASVISFQLNATMLGPAIRDIDTELGPGAFAAMANYFYLSGAIANVVFIRWSDYIGRKRVLLGIMIVLCIGTVLCIVGSSLPVVLLGRILQGGCNVTFGLAFLILRDRLSGQAFGFCCGVIASINGGVAGLTRWLAASWSTISDIARSSSSSWCSVWPRSCSAPGRCPPTIQVVRPRAGWTGWERP